MKPNLTEAKKSNCLKKFYSCEQVAKRYGVKISTVWAWIREQKLPAIRLGGVYRVKESSLVTFEQQNQTSK